MSGEHKVSGIPCKEYLNAKSYPDLNPNVKSLLQCHIPLMAIFTFQSLARSLLNPLYIEKSVTHGQYNARPTVIFLTLEHHCPPAITISLSLSLSSPFVSTVMPASHVNVRETNM